MESKKNKMLAILKRGVEVCRGWKRIWKVLTVLGVITVVAVCVFFSIPSPYADAWDDLFLPYPEQFPGPGTTGMDVSGDTITFLSRGESVPQNVRFRKYYENTGIVGEPIVYLKAKSSWGQYDLVADVEILNYIDISHVVNDLQDEPELMLKCLAVCKIHRIFAQRENVEHNAGDVVTIEFANSSKRSVAPYPELGKGQRWMLVLHHAEKHPGATQFGWYNIYTQSDILKENDWVTDYTANTIMSIACSMPIYRDWKGMLYADTHSLETLLCAYSEEERKELKMFPWELMDLKNHRITDMTGLSEFMQLAMDEWDEEQR